MVDALRITRFLTRTNVVTTVGTHSVTSIWLANYYISDTRQLIFIRVRTSLDGGRDFPVTHIYVESMYRKTGGKWHDSIQLPLEWNRGPTTETVHTNNTLDLLRALERKALIKYGF